MTEVGIELLGQLKKWDLRILDPSPVSAKNRKVKASLGKFIQNTRKDGGET